MTIHQPTNQEKQEFDEKYIEATVRESIIGPDVVWRPYEKSSQVAVLLAQEFEVLYHGTRGPGKTDTLLMSFARQVGKGYGSAWTGILFRQTYPQLADVVAKTEKWFRRMFPTAKFNKAKMQWEFATGEKLLLRHMAKPDDYWNYHGHEYPWIGWEELTNWATDECFKSMFSCCRCSTPGVPKMIRATTNPYGPGHAWIKQRYRLHGKWWLDIVVRDAKDSEGNPEPIRRAIYGRLEENLHLLEADPNYKQTIIASAANPGMAKAWMYGSWDIVAGGMFQDVWDPNHNIYPSIIIPRTWKVDRAFDWGSSKPFSVGWYAESDGSDVQLKDGRVRSTVRGDLFRIKEWYGCTGQPNQGLTMLATEIAEGIVEREILWGFREGQKCRVVAGPADSSIETVENGKSVGRDMRKPVRLNGQVYHGVKWTPADKRAGSRVMGWEAIRQMMKYAHPNEDGAPREEPGLFIIDGENPEFLRTVIPLPRSKKNMDDVDTEVEDHIGDELRYRVRNTGIRTGNRKTTGMY